MPCPSRSLRRAGTTPVVTVPQCSKIPARRCRTGTSYQYDPQNRTLPLNQQELYTYDPVGNLATHTDFNGLQTTYGYDSLNRLLSKTPSSGTGISFTYTATGQRLTMTDPSGTTNYTSYDNRDRLKTKATPEGTLNYTYDAHGNLLTLVSSNTNGASLAYQYDALNRLFKFALIVWRRVVEQRE